MVKIGIRFDSMRNEDVRSVPREIDPYKALACLRAGVEGRSTEGLATLEGDHVFKLEPSQLPSCFFLREPPLSRGYWKEGCRLGISREGPSPMRSLDLRPCYIGMKTFLDFYLPDGTKTGTKTDWVMVEYRLIEHRSTVDDLVLCKVFQRKLKGPVPSDDAAAQLPNQVPLLPTRSSSSPTNPEADFDVDEFLSNCDLSDLNIGVPGPLSGHTGLSIEDYTRPWLNVDAPDVSWGPFSGHAGLSIEDYTAQRFNLGVNHVTNFAAYPSSSRGPFSGHAGLSIEDYAAQRFNLGVNHATNFAAYPSSSRGPPSSGREGQHWQNKEPGVPNEVQGMRKRSRSSGNGGPEKQRPVWEDFTKIHTKYKEVVYAACHYCDRMYKAHPQTDGISHLRRHTAKCLCKMHLHQPSQVLCHSVDRGEGDTAALAPMLGGNQQGDGRCI